MKEYPILFSTPMVQAILAGRKTQTRRVVKPQSPPDIAARTIKCPYGHAGDRLWVRETHYRWTGCGNPPDRFCRDRCYSDDPELRDMERGACLVAVPAIYMPRWASRLTLVVLDARVERLCDITDEDARKEGIADGGCLNCGNNEPCGCPNPKPSPLDSFARLWDSIYAKRGFDWISNPWVWVVDFKEESP